VREGREDSDEQREKDGRIRGHDRRRAWGFMTGQLKDGREHQKRGSPQGDCVLRPHVWMRDEVADNAVN